MARTIPLTDLMYIRLNGRFVTRQVAYIDKEKARPVPKLEAGERVIWHPGSVIPEVAMTGSFICIPHHPTEEMLNILMDEQSPYGYRLSMDKEQFEVYKQTNEDWRHVIAENEIVSEHDTVYSAKMECDRLKAEWRYNQLLDAWRRSNDH